MYDIAIIGSGPAGLSAAVYAARGGMKTCIFEKALIGGQMMLTAEIENYPGFEESQTGFELTEKMRLQAERFGAEFFAEDVIGLSKNGDEFEVKTEEKNYQTKTVIISTGATSRKLGVPGEGKFTGRGVSYCATCDGALYRNKVVAVIGGSESATEEALFLTNFASKVYLIHRENQLQVTRALQQRAIDNETLELVYNSEVKEVNGDTQVRYLTLKDVTNGELRELPLDGVFIYIGIMPNIELGKDNLKLTDAGFIITDEIMQTGVPGLYAAGDIRKKSLRQVVTAAADGAIAAHEAQKWISEQ